MTAQVAGGDTGRVPPEGDYQSAVVSNGGDVVGRPLRGVRTDTAAVASRDDDTVRVRGDGEVQRGAVWHGLINVRRDGAATAGIERYGVAAQGKTDCLTAVGGDRGGGIAAVSIAAATGTAYLRVVAILRIDGEGGGVPLEYGASGRSHRTAATADTERYGVGRCGNEDEIQPPRHAIGYGYAGLADRAVTRGCGGYRGRFVGDQHQIVTICQGSSTVGTGGYDGIGDARASGTVGNKAIENGWNAGGVVGGKGEGRAFAVSTVLVDCSDLPPVGGKVFQAGFGRYRYLRFAKILLQVVDGGEVVFANHQRIGERVAIRVGDRIPTEDGRCSLLATGGRGNRDDGVRRAVIQLILIYHTVLRGRYGTAVTVSDVVEEVVATGGGKAAPGGLPLIAVAVWRKRYGCHTGIQLASA